MRILIITQFFDPEFGAASARLTGLSKELAALGHTVSVITCYPNYPFGKIYSDWKKHPVSLIHDIRVTRVWSYVRPGNSAPYRIINFITFFLFATVNGLKLREKFDVVLSSSPPLIAGLGGVILAKRMGIPHVFDVRDIWPDVAVESGEFSPSSILVKLASTLAQFIYNNSTSITVVTKEKQMRFLQKGYNLMNIHLVENGIDPAIIHNAPRIDLYREFSVNRKRIIAIYAGLLGVAQGVIHLVRIMNTAALQNNVHLLVVGEGSQKKEILEYVREHKLENVTVLDAVGKEKAIGFI
ncbi:MAG: glycosyltransferase family 4 protein, partial [Fidelibacterota bacterium]